MSRSYRALQSAAADAGHAAAGGEGGREGGSFRMNLEAGGVTGGVIADGEPRRFLADSNGDASGVIKGDGLASCLCESATIPFHNTEMSRFARVAWDKTEVVNPVSARAYRGMRMFRETIDGWWTVVYFGTVGGRIE